MAKMWAGRTTGEVSQVADDFNSSLHFDKVMYKQDIKGSMVHAKMLALQGIIKMEEADMIIEALEGILKDITEGKIEVTDGEDIHMFVEAVLTERIGDTGKKLHTARSRNDQVALDLRLYLNDEIEEISNLLLELLKVIARQAEDNIYTIVPGYTHLQRAQPISFAHHLLCYAQMFKRDLSRLEDAKKRMMSNSPLGSCALAGTTFDIDRDYTAKQLGFDAPCANSLDGVSDRDYCVELLSCFSIIMMHLSRFSEEIILWSSWEFKFIELSDAFTTGSSIMPQKKNSDMAELVRGKTGRVYGDLMGTLTMLKGIPLAYNKDMQEDKESIFDALETVKMCLKVFVPMMDSMKVLKENMLNAAKKGFINATDLADYLTKKGMPFRSAYKLTGKIVGECVKTGKSLDELTIDEYKSIAKDVEDNDYSALFEEDLYNEIDLKNCVEKRLSAGGTGFASVKKQLVDIYLN
ncbi:MAG: argininosuccinate lyase [Lachnospiraceae bacterium]|nr:argininosuccinate lyase [Lachnospiraceae bacterium]